MQYAPDVDLIVTLDIKEDVGKSLHGPRAQLWQSQLDAVAWRATGWMSGDVRKRGLHGINKRERQGITTFSEVVVDGSVNVLRSDAAQYDCFALHFLRRLPMQRRNPLK